ncbi:hypothetical protein [Myxosarcina sp. GI1]|uniref:hypothetical protein n=1 Tax=Myxosarcina sp. GI1 TaxID=1541065 RepID=UPI000559F5F4|nr:hypothetical protein [Myxosarcina sp. GI1]
MNQNQTTSASNSDSILQKTTNDIWALAEEHRQDTLFLLFLLRNLEAIHRQIRTEIFEPSLPETRNALYQLVKDIEEQGGWPYIERMKLRDLLIKIEQISPNEPEVVGDTQSSTAN